MKTKDELLEKFVQKNAEILTGDSIATEKRHQRNQLTARERIDLLIDQKTFVEEFRFSESQCHDFGMDEIKRPTDGVVCGYGQIEGRRVFIFAQDRTVLNASVGGVHGEKIAQTIASAHKAGVPCIGLFDSVVLPLRAGENEILIAVTEAFGGWGVMAEFENLEGITILNSR